MKSWLRTSSPLPAIDERAVTHGGPDAAFGEITDEVDDAGEDAQDRQALERWLDDGGAVSTDDESR
jgi:hypothetical protein